MSLFEKVSLLLTLSMVVGALGAFVGRKIQSLAAFILLAIAFIGGTFVVMAVSGGDPAVAISVLLGWVFISGLVVGPAIEMYIEDLGWETVAGCYLGTAGVMAVCGAIGALSGINFSGLGSILFIALFGLIITGIVGIFVRLSREGNMIYAGIGMVVFAGYFLFDFFRLSKSTNTWQAAIELTMNIYLDFVNFLLYLLKFIAAAKDKDHSSMIQHGAHSMVAMLHHAGPAVTTLAHHAQPALNALGLC